MQSSLPAGWLAFTGRVSNPLDREERFQISFILLSWTFPDATKIGLGSIDKAIQAHVRELLYQHEQLDKIEASLDSTDE
jgi:hypothetical protein